MELEVQGSRILSPDTEPGMNIISTDFDLIMVNRPNERLYGKPMVELLGKKCYREFEKRDEPCPHCPGRRSLLTGGTHEAETTGLRDDGTWFSARVRTYPVQGLGDVPTGFIEVVEDITEEKRAEKLGRIEADLRAVLASVQNVRRALTLAFEAALTVESIDAGCVFLLGETGDGPELVAAKGLGEDCLSTLLDRLVTDEGDVCTESLLAGLDEATRSAVVVPISHRGDTIALLVAASYTYGAVPLTLAVGLESLGATVAGTIGRIRAEQSRGDAVADLEAVITHAPVAAFVLDPERRVTMWNKAAERLFGWRAAEVVKRVCPLPHIMDDLLANTREPLLREASLQDREGRTLHVRLTVAPFRDLVGVASTIIVMVEDLTDARRASDLEVRLRIAEERLARAEREGAIASSTGPKEPDQSGHSAPTTKRALLLDCGDRPMKPLSTLLVTLSYEPVVVESLAAAIDAVEASVDADDLWALAVVEVVASDGSSGIAHMAALRAAGFAAPVIVSSDVEVRGHREHGFAGSVRRPYEADAVQRVLGEVLATQERRTS